MDKKEYRKPSMYAESFVPNEYIAQCSHSESGAGNYLFECNAGTMNGHNYSYGTIYRESYGSSDVFNYDSRHIYETFIDDFEPCKKKHEAPTTDEFSYGWFVPWTWEGGLIFGDWVKHYDQAFKVIIWQGDGDLHATENLNRDTWEKNHS